ncbi:phage major capsid protein [Rhodococcus sp. 14-2470-1b]|uniref:phage major capsid protein n=1 Tax=Rhodococcus sp. 14-2470-1b TaxID=2023149 RepID=UPI000B9A38CA|nr:phage major capsid protein [Rhodococcus sp. 14-2470-1b]OZF46378.1 phage major capsid protein [Rhodococcus sp. 14-2470-1b]
MHLKTMNKAELQAFLAEARAELEGLATRGADLTGADSARFEELEGLYKEARSLIAAIDKRSAAVIDGFDAGTITEDNGTTLHQTRAAKSNNPLRGKVLLRSDESMTEWAAANGEADSADISIGRLLRGLHSNDWTNAEEERALSVANQTSAGVLVPVKTATQIIDKARNQAAVLLAGATVVPLSTSVTRVPRLTGEGTPDFYAEGAQRNAKDLTFDSLTLTARSFDRLIIVSNELLEDSDPSAAGVIEDAFAKQFALGLDQAALFADGINPNPTGLFNTAGVPKVNHGTNGTKPTDYDWLVQAAGNVLAQNFVPTGTILSPRTATTLQLLKDTQGRYLSAPEGLPTPYVTNQVPNNFTTGTSNVTSALFVGDWSQLYIGVRKSFTIKTIDQRWADQNSTGFLAQMRIDIGVAQPLAFEIHTGILA